jgi:hypothetical protein
MRTNKELSNRHKNTFYVRSISAREKEERRKTIHNLINLVFHLCISEISWIGLSDKDSRKKVKKLEGMYPFGFLMYFRFKMFFTL